MLFIIGAGNAAGTGRSLGGEPADRCSRRGKNVGPAARRKAEGAALQLVVMAAVLTDLRSRSAEEINGPRWVWAMLSAVNIVGPIANYAFRRRSTVPAAERRPSTVSQ
jgi:hypothetical protein